MTECVVPEKKPAKTSTFLLLVFICAFAVIGAILSLISSNFGRLFLAGDAEYIPGGAVYEIIFVLLTIITDFLYIVGGAVIAFGAALSTIRFFQCKLRSPYEPSCVSRHLSGYLTLSLEFFIGAEIVKTVVVRTYAEFLVLILVILSRGLFSLILYLERRWHGGAETE